MPRSSNIQTVPSLAIVALLLTVTLATLPGPLAQEALAHGDEDDHAHIPSFDPYRVEAVAPVPLDTTGWTTVDLGDDDSLAWDLPWVPFFGNLESRILVHANGFVQVGATEANAGCCAGGKIPHADAPNGLVAAFWTDLDPSDCGLVQTHDDGATVWVAWTDVPYYGVSCEDADGARVSAYLSIARDDGQVEVHVLAADGDGVVATSGLESADASEGNESRRSAEPLAEPLAWRFVRTSSDPLPEPPQPPAHYVVEAITPVAADLTGWTDLGLDDDSGVTTTVPAFPFYGDTYEALTISSNGFVFPGSSTHGPTASAAIVGNDLDPGSCGSVLRSNHGDLIQVAWSDVGYYGSGCRDAAPAPLDVALPRIEGARVDAHLTINVTTGVIEIHLLRDDGGHGSTDTRIENVDGTQSNTTRDSNGTALAEPMAWRFTPVGGDQDVEPEPEPEPEPVAPRVETFQISGVIECGLRAGPLTLREMCPEATADVFRLPRDRGLTHVRFELDWDEAETTGAHTLQVTWQNPPGAIDPTTGPAPLHRSQDLPFDAVWQEDGATASFEVTAGPDEGLVHGQAFSGCVVFVYGDAEAPADGCLA